MPIYKSQAQGLLIIPDAEMKLKPQETFKTEAPSKQTEQALSAGLLVEVIPGNEEPEEGLPETDQKPAGKPAGPRGRLRTPKN